MKKNINSIISVFIYVLCGLSVTALLTSCGGSDGDNTIENWFVAIIFLLALLKRS